MTKKAKKSAAKEVSDEAKGLPKGFWTIERLRTLLDALREQAAAGNRSETGFKPQAWRQVATKVSASVGTTLTKDQVKSAFNQQLAKKYKIVCALLQLSGFGIDLTTGAITADDDVWAQYLSAHPAAAEFREKGWPLYEGAHELLSGHTATGRFAALPGTRGQKRSAAAESDSETQVELTPSHRKRRDQSHSSDGSSDSESSSSGDEETPAPASPSPPPQASSHRDVTASSATKTARANRSKVKPPSTAEAIAMSAVAMDRMVRALEKRQAAASAPAPESSSTTAPESSSTSADTGTVHARGIQVLQAMANEGEVNDNDFLLLLDLVSPHSASGNATSEAGQLFLQTLLALQERFRLPFVKRRLEQLRASSTQDQG